MTELRLAGADRTASPLRDLPWLARQIIRVSPWEISLWAALTLIGAALSAASLWAMHGAVNALVAQAAGVGESLLWWTAVLIGLFVAQQGAQVVLPWLRQRVRLKAGFALQNEALRKMGRLPQEAFDRQSTYDLIHRVAEGADSKAPALVQGALSLVQMLPILAVNALVLAAVSPYVLLIVVVGEVLLLWQGTRIGARERRFEVERTRERRLADYYAQVLTTNRFAPEVRLFGLQTELLHRWRSTLTRYLRDRLRVTFRNALQSVGSSVGFTFVIAAAPVLVVVLGGQVEPGLAALVLTAIRTVAAGMHGTLRGAQQFRTQAGYASDLRILLEEMQSEASPRASELTEGRGEIRLENVSYRYPGAEQHALQSISLHVQSGEVVAVVGANGAGKTTLAQILMGLRRPTAGRVLMDGVDTATCPPEQVREACTAVFQQPIRYPATVRENITLTAAQQKQDEQVWHLQAQVGLGEGTAVNADQLLGPEFGGIDLSGGQWQRLAIARALARSETRFVMFDEPTAALDPLAELALFEQFVELAAGRTTILISHRLGPTRLANRVVVLDHGRIVEEGPPDELLAREGRFAEMFEAQAEWYQ